MLPKDGHATILSFPTIPLLPSSKFETGNRAANGEINVCNRLVRGSRGFLGTAPRRVLNTRLDAVFFEWQGFKDAVSSGSKYSVVGMGRLFMVCAL